MPANKYVHIIVKSRQDSNTEITMRQTTWTKDDITLISSRINTNVYFITL